MEEKRYQVFVSSTYVDLKNERELVRQALIDMNCFPSGMENFPAASEEQFEYIKKVIDDCDYYILILGGRYGSLDENGVSYTEKEFRYALSKNIKVIAFVRENLNEISSEKMDANDKGRKKFLAFRAEVVKDRVVKMWSIPESLPGMVVVSLQKLIKDHPATGWIKANKAAQVDVLNQLNDLRNELDVARQENERLRNAQKVSVAGLADMNDLITISGTYAAGLGGTQKYTKETTWGEIFRFLSPRLLVKPTGLEAVYALHHMVRQIMGFNGDTQIISFDQYDKVKLHFKTLKLIDLKFDGSVSSTSQAGKGQDGGLVWSLTAKGDRLMDELNATKK